MRPWNKTFNWPRSKVVLPEEHKAVLPVGETVQDPRSAERPGNALVLPWMTLQEVSDGREVWISPPLTWPVTRGRKWKDGSWAKGIHWLQGVLFMCN